MTTRILLFQQLFQLFRGYIMAKINTKKTADYIIETNAVRGQYTPIATEQGADQPPPFILGIRGALTIRIRTKAE